MNGTAPLEESALVSFTTRNVRCYRDSVTLSMQATRLANKEVVRELRTGAVDPEHILSCAAIFGANASGKSAILKAILDMGKLILFSFREGDREGGISRIPFLLGSSSTDSSEFAVELIIDGVFWEYGFEVDDQKVIAEYAHYYPFGRRALVFERDEEQVVYGTRFKSLGKGIKPLLRKNALLLSIIGALEAPEAGRLFDWWSQNLRHYKRSSIRKYGTEYTAHKANNAEQDEKRILRLLQAADLGVTNLEVNTPGPTEPSDPDFVPPEIKLIHRGDGREVTLEPEDESLGTQVLLGWIGPILSVLENGTLLLVDELDASLHPNLVTILIDLFQNPSTNQRCAQLVFNSHDATILDSQELFALGRDQVWFSEKGRDGASTLTALAEYQGRRDEAVGRRYLRGRYGAVPKLDPSEIHLALDH